MPDEDPDNVRARQGGEPIAALDVDVARLQAEREGIDSEIRVLTEGAGQQTPPRVVRKVRDRGQAVPSAARGEVVIVGELEQRAVAEQQESTVPHVRGGHGSGSKHADGERGAHPSLPHVVYHEIRPLYGAAQTLEGRSLTRRGPRPRPPRLEQGVQRGRACDR